eukprot:GHRR01023746.1.p1 GENE.GHRR01023746.1~~GHRR01023746.1.p1  ORF type:complete len:172 (+),score=35.29 GHRR01023746.1:928-1443(+)
MVWPGKGLFMLFIAKPWSINPAGIKPADTHCAGPWVQQPWLMPLVSLTRTNQAALFSSTAASSADSSIKLLTQVQSSKAADPWTSSGLIRLKYLAHHRLEDSVRHSKQGFWLSAVKHTQQAAVVRLRKEKNWNPFIYKNELYFSHMSSSVLGRFVGGACGVLLIREAECCI